MLKKLILILMLLAAPVMAEEVNMTPQNTFSGFNNNGVRPTYPRLGTNKTTPPADNRADIMKPKSVRDMGADINSANNGKTPMNYGQFPQNYDSSNMMHMQNLRNGMQNMFMDY